MTTTRELAGWTHVSSGKVRDIYKPASTPEGQQPDRLLMVTSDRISAYDYILPTPIPDKGKVLNQMALWWMDTLKDIIGNHVITAVDVPDEVRGRAVVCRALNMAPIECVVRGYLTGSGLIDYRKNGAVCGIALPEGLTEASRLDEPIFTPAAKAELGEHDENIDFTRMASMVGQKLAQRLQDVSIALYTRARSIAAERGVILADTKFEFGVNPDNGDLILADEVLTPDSSRFWPADKWVEGRVTPSFDKQFLRDWLTSTESGWVRGGETPPPALPDSVVNATRERYIEAFSRLTGQEPQL